MKRVATAAIFLTLFFLGGCTSDVSDCNNSSVKESALDIIDSHLNQMPWYHEIRPNLSKIEISNIKTTSINKEIKEKMCEAKYSASFFDKEIKIDFPYKLSYLEDKKDTEVSVNLEPIKSHYAALIMVGGLRLPKPVPAQTQIPPQVQSTTETYNLPDFKENESYTDIRAKMLASGWTPYHSENADTCSEFDSRCKDRPEMESCAGTGMANCRFLWKKDEKITGICTVGEDVAFESICNQ
jgi:hypothetical protein